MPGSPPRRNLVLIESEEPIMFSPTIHTDFARQLQQDRLAGIRIERRSSRRTGSGSAARLVGRLLRRPASLVPTEPAATLGA
jgi:hypothetical protein